MSAAAVRKAITTYFTKANIPGVAHVYKAMPWFLAGQKFQTWPQDGSWSAVLVLNLDSVSETRATLPAPNVLLPDRPIGNKVVRYKVGMLIVFQMLIPTTQPQWQNEAVWVDYLDQLIDDITDALRADPNLGDPSVIFQAAQDPDDITISRDLPTLDSGGGVLHAWQLIEFSVVEIITA